MGSTCIPQALSLTANATESSQSGSQLPTRHKFPMAASKSVQDLLLHERSGCLNPVSYAIGDVSVTHSIGVLATSDQSDGNERRELYCHFD